MDWKWGKNDWCIESDKNGNSNKPQLLLISTPNISNISDTDIPSTNEDDAMSTETDVEQPEPVKKDRKRQKDTTSNYHCTYCMAGYKTKMLKTSALKGS